MNAMRAGTFLCGLAALPAAAQLVSVYSEFTRIDPYGNVVKADRGPESPREILSPAVPRGAFSSFHLVVEGQPGDSYTVQVAQNPHDAVKVTAYRERYTKIGDEWVPDALEPVTLPYDGRLANAQIPDQTAQAFWVDMWVDPNAPVRRIKVEAQGFLGAGWIRYPMEVRIMETSLGLAAPVSPSDPGTVAGASTAEAAMYAWVRSQCNSVAKPRADSAVSVRNLIARNAGQDVRLAAGSAPPELLRVVGASGRAGLCRAGVKPRSPEEYLQVRDLLVGARE